MAIYRLFFGNTTGGGVNIVCSLGTAAALGYAATVAATDNIDCALGTAAASGHQATVEAGVTISCALGQATASGYQATIPGSVNIDCALGTAAASGYQATIGGGGGTVSFRLKNNTATALAAESGIRAFVYQFDGTLVQTTYPITLDGNGDASITSASIVANDWYAVFFQKHNGTAVGAARIQAT